MQRSEATTAGFDDKLSTRLYLFPNPSHDWLYVQFLNNDNAETEYSIYDLKGSEVGKGVFEDLTEGKNVKKIDVSLLPTGYYVLELVSGESKWTQKVRCGISAPGNYCSLINTKIERPMGRSTSIGRRLVCCMGSSKK